MKTKIARITLLTIFAAAFLGVLGSVDQKQIARANAAPLAQCMGPSNGRVSCWAGESNANDSVGINDGTTQGGATYATGKDGEAFSFNGTTGHILVPDSSSLDVTT